MSIVAVMAIVVSALWVLIRQVDHTDVGNLDPTTAPSSPEASPPGTPPPATPPGPATPEGDDGLVWPTGSLPDLLGYAPDRLADDSLPLNDVARYADIAGWMTAHGVTTPASLTDPAILVWKTELDNLAIPLSLRERGLEPVWQSTYGFNLTQVEQVLIVGQAPDYVMILKGAFNAGDLQTAWVANGYQAVEVEGATVWSLFPGDTIDLSAQESRPAMGTLNNMVMLEDGTLVAAAKTSRLGSVLDVVNDGAASLAEQDDIAALLLPETGAGELVSAVISKGSLLQSAAGTMPASVAVPTPEIGLVATPDDEAGMPEVNIVLLGIPLPRPRDVATPDSDAAEAHLLAILLVFDGDNDAGQARVEIETRLGQTRSPVTGHGYRDRLAGVEFSLLEQEDRSVMVLTGELTRGITDWLTMLSDRDLGFMLWIPEE